MKKLLVTGASGFLGNTVCREARETWDVFGTFCAHPVSIKGVKTLQVDISDPVPFAILFRDIRPDAVIHCAAWSDPNRCQQNPEESYRNNVGASVAVASLCAQQEIPCVFTSSDLVFSGENPPYNEQSARDPINLYGNHKVAAEHGMRRVYPAVTICRMPLMFGDVAAPAQSFIQPMILSIVNSRQLKLFTDEFRTPVSGTTAARGLLLALGMQGETLHLGGRERISRYEFGVLLAEALKKNGASIVPALQKDVVFPAVRARDVSLTSEKAFALGYDPKLLAQQLAELECVKSLKEGIRQ
jgi:dTDP-4-dehydrorhamnose reductase